MVINKNVIVIKERLIFLLFQTRLRTVTNKQDSIMQSHTSETLTLTHRTYLL
jgi:hypothetical protein